MNCVVRIGHVVSLKKQQLYSLENSITIGHEHCQVGYCKQK